MPLSGQGVSHVVGPAQVGGGSALKCVRTMIINNVTGAAESTPLSDAPVGRSVSCLQNDARRRAQCVYRVRVRCGGRRAPAEEQQQQRTRRRAERRGGVGEEEDGEERGTRMLMLMRGVRRRGGEEGARERAKK